jgi:[acyl-carrier-protein] S-malonyltransferase
MQADLANEFEVVRSTWEEAADVSGLDLWAIVVDGPKERLGETTITQPAMLAAGVAAWRAWCELGGAEPAVVSGHSLGEYSALVAAGALSFADAMTVVKRRSELMQEAVPKGVGGMAAIIGLDDQAVVDACRAAAGDEVVEPVNFNAPGQVVIAGHATAIDRAIDVLKSAGAKRAIALPVSVPSHSTLMQPAGEALRATLDSISISTPSITTIAATDATPYGDGDDIRARLARQVYSPVRWVGAVTAMLERGADRVVECGPGKVLAGLQRRIDRTIPVATIDSLDGLRSAAGA